MMKNIKQLIENHIESLNRMSNVLKESAKEIKGKTSLNKNNQFRELLKKASNLVDVVLLKNVSEVKQYNNTIKINEIPSNEMKALKNPEYSEYFDSKTQRNYLKLIKLTFAIIKIIKCNPQSKSTIIHNTLENSLK